ncbi:hypothetical protein DXG01_013237 [Tephrocybe rancida]|nr:hypothetical protein DXG01_013237 [Tephrocybe rancida]
MCTRLIEALCAAVGRALAAQNRPLIYGGGMQGLMGVVATTVLRGGGEATGVIPYAMHVAGGERDKSGGPQAPPAGVGAPEHAKMQTIVVDSMHERKVEMASRSVGFIGLPGGFGTFEEVCRSSFESLLTMGLSFVRSLKLPLGPKSAYITNVKPLKLLTSSRWLIPLSAVILLNVLSFYNPLRQLIENGIKEGYIHPENKRLIIFVDGPSRPDEHEDFDWGTAALDAIDKWQGDDFRKLFNWTHRKDGTLSEPLGSS